MSAVSRYYLLAFIITPLLLGCNKIAFCETNIHVRVLILAKYKPINITISHKNDKSNKIIINKNSTLPIHISQGDQYQISIPDADIKRSYAGTITIDNDKNNLRIINSVHLEDYVESVVLSEIGLQHQEAMRAQAILARTWAVKHLRPKKKYDFNDLTNSQVYKGIFSNINLKPNILSLTQGQILTYNRLPIKVFYHSDCATRGYSAYEIWGLQHFPYYIRTVLPNELQSQPPRKWLRKIMKSEINEIFYRTSELNTNINYKKSTNKGQHGIYINEQWYDIDTFRLKVNRVLGWNQLRSNHFTLTDKNKFLIFKGSGFGHLVGLCQKGAIQLAKQGWLHTKILELFYPRTKLTSY